MPYTNVKDPEQVAKMDSCVAQVMAQGQDKPAAIAICYSSILGKKVLLTNCPLTDRPLSDMRPPEGGAPLDWAVVGERTDAWATTLLSLRFKAAQPPCSVAACDQPATRWLGVGVERLYYCDTHVSGAKELLTRHKLVVNAETPVLSEFFEVKEGRFITKDNRVIFIGGPGSGSGGSRAAGTPFGTAARTGGVSAERELGGGVTDTSLVEYVDDGTGVFKTLRDAKAYAHDGNSEVAAYRINQLLGGNEVPETVYTSLGGVRGTAQEFITGATLGEDTSILALQALDPAIKDRAVALDAIIGNVDRHPGNFLFRDGQLFLIDHGHANWLSLSWDKSAIAHNSLVEAFTFNAAGLSSHDTVGMLPMGLNKRYTFQPESLAAWRNITKTQWDAAFTDVGQTYRVNATTGWHNLQRLLEQGYVEGY